MKKLNALFVIVKSYHIGNHVIVEFEQLVPPVELIGRSHDSDLKTTTKLECPFCHEGSMREQSCMGENYEENNSWVLGIKNNFI